MSHTDKDNSKIEKRVTEALDTSIDDLHPDIRRKLNQARIKAMQVKTVSPFYKQPKWKVAGAVSFVITLSVISMSNNQESGQMKNTLAENSAVGKSMIFEESLSSEEINLLENLEFALWMAEEVEIASL